MIPDSISPGSLKSEDEHRRDVCAAGRWIHQQGWVAATDGNISVRLDPRRILTSPTGMSKGMMAPDDLVITDLSGKKLAGLRNPSSELAMHLLIYKRRPDIHSVCHAHPPTATGFAAARLPLNKAIASEVVISLGCIPVAKYGTPGTSELTDSLATLVTDYDAILMANHGVVTYGPDLLTAYFRMETTEHFARVTLVTEILGKQVLLSGGDVEKLLAARERYGLKTASRPAPDCPVTADTAGGAQPGSALLSATGRAEQTAERITVTREQLEALIEEAVRTDRSRR